MVCVWYAQRQVINQIAYADRIIINKKDLGMFLPPLDSSFPPFAHGFASLFRPQCLLLRCKPWPSACAN
jgi:hypothetical protein